MRVGQSRRRDTNEAQIVQAWAAIGVLSWPISGPGLGDRLTYCPATGVWLPVEIKSASGRFTRQQRAVRAVAPYPAVRSVAEAVALFGVREAQP